MTMRVLFVCSNNVSRSPMAAAVLRHLARAQKRDIEVDSAGLQVEFVGQAAHRYGIEATAARGIPIGNHCARFIKAADFAAFDVIVALDRSDLRLVNDMCNLSMSKARYARSKLRLFTSFLGDDMTSDIPDPYHGGREKFDAVLDMIEKGVRELLLSLREQKPVARGTAVFPK